MGNIEDACEKQRELLQGQIDALNEQIEANSRRIERALAVLRAAGEGN
jgi:hypothetical protein